MEDIEVSLVILFTIFNVIIIAKLMILFVIYILEPFLKYIRLLVDFINKDNSNYD